MFQFLAYSRIRVLFLALLVSGVLPAVVIAEDNDEALSFLAENSVIHSSVLSVLEQDAVAPVVVTFDLPPIETSRYAHHPAAKTDVHPLLFDMVASAEPGTIRVEEVGPSFALHARMSVAALRALGDNPDILAIDLDPNPVILDSIALDEKFPETNSKTHCPCTPVIGSTLGCVSGNRWRVTVNHGGAASKVAAYGGQSAAFWTYSSGNWEILGKVINGCGYNGYWWVFAAGATAGSYTVTVRDANNCTNYKTYSSASFGNPVVDTSAFTCP